MEEKFKIFTDKHGRLPNVNNPGEKELALWVRENLVNPDLRRFIKENDLLK